ncbi:MAG: hypothetical protein MJZ81_04595, partial [Bacteroidales bacterium]|nr:hypothetical protein [Bacteroidales bacterium]
RAAMLAYFLWEEKNTPAIRAKVKKFGVWVANCCLRQFLLRFNLESSKTSTFKFKEVYDALPEEFDTKKISTTLIGMGYKSPARQTISQWKMLGVIRPMTNEKYCTQFKKTDAKV